MLYILVFWIMTLYSHIYGYSIVKCSRSSSPWEMSVPTQLSVCTILNTTHLTTVTLLVSLDRNPHYMLHCAFLVCQECRQLISISSAAVKMLHQHHLMHYKTDSCLLSSIITRFRTAC
jgi:hypothetical protein